MKRDLIKYSVALCCFSMSVIGGKGHQEQVVTVAFKSSSPIPHRKENNRDVADYMGKYGAIQSVEPLDMDGWFSVKLKSTPTDLQHFLDSVKKDENLDCAYEDAAEEGQVY